MNEDPIADPDATEQVSAERRHALARLGLGAAAVYTGLSVLKIERAYAKHVRPSDCRQAHRNCGHGGDGGGGHGGDGEGGDDGGGQGGHEDD